MFYEFRQLGTLPVILHPAVETCRPHIQLSNFSLPSFLDGLFDVPPGISLGNRLSLVKTRLTFNQGQFNLSPTVLLEVNRQRDKGLPLNS